MQDNPELAPRRTWTLYVLRCNDGSLYTGSTSDLVRRLQEHRTGRGARYTRGRRPLELIASWPCDDQSAALRAEARFKRLSRQRKLVVLSMGAAPPFACPPRRPLT